MKLPSVFRVRLPWAGPATRLAVSAAVSMSLSLASTPLALAMTRGISSTVLNASLVTTGASFTGNTVMVTGAALDTFPVRSFMVYEKVSLVVSEPSCV